MDEWQVFRIDGDPQAPGQARNLIESAVGERFGIDLLNELKLLVSEVVTNSVRHGGADSDGAIKLGLTINGASLRVDVVDHGPGFRPGRKRRIQDEFGGWGLYLVEQLSDSWGVEETDTTRVWFQLATERYAAAGDESVFSLSA